MRLPHESRYSVDSQFAVIPAAIGMMLGPQIISSIFLATSKKPRPNSLAYISGVFLASTIGMLIAFYSARLFGAATDNSEKGQDALTYLIVALLVFLSIKTFLERKTAKTPEWMGTLQEAEPKFAFRLGLTLILLMPTDIIIMLSAGAYLVLNEFAFTESFLLIGATTLVAALPLLAIVLVGPRADEAMPHIREWMSKNSWLISIIVYVFFIYAMLS
jgi:threonine/homoserine/homoserine lactone efflux protein